MILVRLTRLGFIVSSTLKGNALEDALYEYLLDQQRRGQLLYDTHDPDRCRIHRKKKYYCRDRGAEVEFDVVIELYRTGSQVPHSVVIFECKNYRNAVPETEVRDFSHKLRTLPYAAKGVIVVSSRLQSGADSVARSNNIGIAKYDKLGLDVVADRRGRSCFERGFVQSQIFQDKGTAKALKFSAFYDGNFFGNLGSLLVGLDPEFFDVSGVPSSSKCISIPYLYADHIKGVAQGLLRDINYRFGPVDLREICSLLSIRLKFTESAVHDDDGTFILGTANFDRRLIEINSHDNPHRERFTIAHEIGHFCLEHQRYLGSDNVVATDLLTDSELGSSFNYERLEYQANMFASDLLLPEETFRVAIDVARDRVNMKNRGQGYIYVDDQPWNRADYIELLANLSDHFQASQQVVEIKLKTLGLLNDQRKRGEVANVGESLSNFAHLK